MLEEIYNEYDKMQVKYGDPSLKSIIAGGCRTNPDYCFVFMNPTGRNIASYEDWKGIRAPWIGTKNIWDLFYAINIIDKDLYLDIKSKKPKDWTEEYAYYVYSYLTKKKCYITNLAKCTQTDARALPDSIYKEYLDLFKKEIDIVNPKVIFLFGNQVSSIVLNEKIQVSLCRKKKYILDSKYPCYAVYYPIGNGRFNIDKSIEDILEIMQKEEASV